ncbi:MAG: CidA/LrgA family protein [Brotaphodocola sp.]
MKVMKECAIIFGITLAGEGLNYLLPLPVPAGVYGLFLLLFLLCSGILKLEDVEATGNFLLDIMPVLFVPAAVGLMESFDLMRSILIPLAVTVVISTIIVMVVTGKVAEFVMNHQKKGGDKR